MITTEPIQSLARYTCLRCEHVWVPRKEGYPKKCPKCTSFAWNRDLYPTGRKTKKKVYTDVSVGMSIDGIEL